MSTRVYHPLTPGSKNNLHPGGQMPYIRVEEKSSLLTYKKSGVKRKKQSALYLLCLRTDALGAEADFAFTVDGAVTFRLVFFLVDFSAA